MLSPPSQTNRSSTIPAPGSIHPLQEYLSNLQSEPPEDFPGLDEENDESENEQKSSQRVTNGGEHGQPDFTHLVSNKDFSELFKQFFVVGHKKLAFLRSELLLKRDVNPNTLITPSDINAHKIQALREHLYRLQMTFFKNPKGKQYNTLF